MAERIHTTSCWMRPGGQRSDCGASPPEAPLHHCMLKPCCLPQALMAVALGQLAHTWGAAAVPSGPSNPNQPHESTPRTSPSLPSFCQLANIGINSDRPLARLVGPDAAEPSPVLGTDPRWMVGCVSTLPTRLPAPLLACTAAPCNPRASRQWPHGPAHLHSPPQRRRQSCLREAWRSPRHATSGRLVSPSLSF